VCFDKIEMYPSSDVLPEVEEEEEEDEDEEGDEVNLPDKKVDGPVVENDNIKKLEYP